jgi:uncharacterized protein YigE (DUF2233 family)
MLRSLLALTLLLFALASPALAQNAACSTSEFEGVPYDICDIDLRETRLALFWKDPSGTPYRNLRTFAQSAEGAPSLFAMNAGMYEPDSTPVGLYIENGELLRSANTNDGRGNFHLKPNGVFYVDGDVAGVMETSAFLESGITPDFATQSGPMLLIGGDLHPRFIIGSDSRKIRNGVCVEDRHRVVFAISRARVNFEGFARLFRDVLGCTDALYFDGTISSLYAPELGRNDFFFPVGPIIAALPR